MNGALLSSKNMGWCTPADFFSELDQEFHFNLDPAATDKSAKCARYFTPADDGLKADWGGCRVFCNPPYGRQITDWVRKGYEESKKPGTLVVMLIPARTDTSYFHDYIFHGKADEVRFIRGRLTFTDDGISQQVVMKTGVTKKENAIIPNPVRLIPYRTFLEVEQPESEFVFRITEGRGGAPAFKLVSADGGRWEAVAVDNVKSYLMDALADIPNREQITIIA